MEEELWYSTVPAFLSHRLFITIKKIPRLIPVHICWMKGFWWLPPMRKHILLTRTSGSGFRRQSSFKGTICVMLILVSTTKGMYGCTICPVRYGGIVPTILSNRCIWYLPIYFPWLVRNVIRFIMIRGISSGLLLSATGCLLLTRITERLFIIRLIKTWRPIICFV